MITTPFDLLIFGFVLGAFWLSENPKRQAVFFCLYTVGLITVSDHLLPAEFTLYAAVLLEISAAVSLLYFGQREKQTTDRWFFFAMSGFMLTSVAITIGYSIGLAGLRVGYGSYIFYSHAVAVAHVAFMIGFSDGIKRNIGRFLDSLLRSGSGSLRGGH